jgi:hypothetical protein
LTFHTALLGGGGIIDASLEDTGTTSFIDNVPSKLIFEFFEGGGSVSPLELIIDHISYRILEILTRHEEKETYESDIKSSSLAKKPDDLLDV